MATSTTYTARDLVAFLTQQRRSVQALLAQVLSARGEARAELFTQQPRIYVRAEAVEDVRGALGKLYAGLPTVGGEEHTSTASAISEATAKFVPPPVGVAPNANDAPAEVNGDPY